MRYADLSQLAAYKKALGISESSGNYAIENGIGALGKYQFMPSRLRHLSNYFHVPYPDKKTFLSSPALQDDFFRRHIELSLEEIFDNGLDGYIGHEITGRNRAAKYGKVIINIYGLLAGLHLGGAGGTARLLKQGIDVDDNKKGEGTYISDYIAKFSYLVPENFDVKKKFINILEEIKVKPLLNPYIISAIVILTYYILTKRKVLA